MTWAELKKLATSYVNRKDIDWNALLPLALGDVNNAVRVQENEAFASLANGASPVAALFQVPLPPDFHAPRAAFADGELTPTDIQGLLGARAPWRQYAISGG